MKNFSRSLLALVALGALLSIHAADSILVRLVYNPGNQAGPFTVTWPSVAGQSYDLLVTSELGREPWLALNPAPIVATSATTSFTDPALSRRRFYQIRQLVVSPGTEPPLSTASVAPRQAALAPGGTQLFRATFPAGVAPIWSVHGFSGVAVGNISAGGVYTAPNEIPDPPFVIVRAQSSVDPAQAAEATIQFLPETELQLTRDQAVEILIRNVIEPLPGKTNLLALALHEVIDSSSRLHAHSPRRDATVALIPVTGPSWFFMTDENPLGAWSHAVNYILINARSGVVERNVSQQWYPEIDGEPLWNSFERVELPRDQVYVGSSLAAELASPPAFPEEGALRAQSGENFLPIHRVFPAAPTACDAPPIRRYAVVGVMSPEEGRLIHSGNTWQALFQANGFSTKLVPNGNASAVLLELDRLRSVVRPTDVLFLYLLGHGVGGSATGISSSEIANALSLIPTSGKYFILESCDAGYVYENFQAQRVVPRVQILTASNKANPPDPFRGTSPLKVASFDSGFTAVLLRCLSRYDTLAEVHECITSLTDSGPIALRMKLADPQLGFVGDADSDQDGVLDKMENDLGLDPNNPDSDGDGVCDGIEFGQLATIEKRNDDGSRDISYAFGLRQPVFTAKPALPAAVAAVSYTTTLTIASGVPFRSNPANSGNPFGSRPTPPWTLSRGTIPQGLALDGQNGRLFGTPTVAGTFRFEATYTDAIGARARRTFELTVESVQAGGTPEILITTTADGNVRDDDISLREAAMLASGKLLLSELRPDPDLNNGISEGEVRWVTRGAPGANSRDLIRAQISAGAGLNVSSPVLIEGEGDDFQIPSSYRIIGGQGPVLEITGNRNEFNSLVGMRVNSGPAVVVRGHFNHIGLSVALTSNPSSEFRGGGTGEGVLVFGNGNSFAGLIIRGFDAGVRFTGGASQNTITRGRIVENNEGIVIDAAAHNNTIRECTVGFMFTSVAPPVPASNTGAGVVLAGGASSNIVIECGIGGNGGAGVLIQDAGTDANEILDSRIGTMQGTSSTRGEAGPNRKNGVVIAGGAKRNRLGDLEITSNIGHGILITDAGTSLNEVGTRDADAVIVNKPDEAGDGVRIEREATLNSVSVKVDRSGGSGVVIAGAGTVSNRVTHRLFSNVHYPTIISNTAGPAIVIRDGASRNTIEASRLLYAPHGVLLTGEATRENILTGLSIERNTVAGIRLESGAEANRITGSTSIQGNKSGIVIFGEQTRGNLIENTTFGFLTPNETYAVELREGAQDNGLENISVQNQQLGGILLDGTGTRGNRIEKSTLRGGLMTNQIAASGTAITVQNGAAGNLISENTIQDNGGHGVLISGSTTLSNRVFNNTFTANLLEGIRILNAPNNFIGSRGGRGNRFHNHASAAIRVGGAGAGANRISGNLIGGSSTFATNASHGIFLEAGADRTVIGGPLPQQRDAGFPQILLRPDPDARAGGNWIAGNGGDGIRIMGAHSNRISGNLIGYSESADAASGNGGHGISITGSQGNRIGNALPPGRRNAGNGNHIAQNRGAGIFLSGTAASGNTVLHNRIYSNTSAAFSRVQSANGNVQPPDASIDVVAAEITGTAPVAGYIELFSNRPNDPGVYHLTAFVRRGEYRIDQLRPERCLNASIIESDRPIRYGTQQLSFTDPATGNTSEYLEFTIDAPVP